MKRRIVGIAVIIAFITAATGCLKSSSKVLGNVMGRVYDSNGHALKGARVEVYGANLAVETDALGRYAIYNTEPGQRKLVATYNGQSVVKIVEIPRGGTLEDADLLFSVIDQLPPIITDVLATDLTENTAVIRWTTSELADSIVDYATGAVGLGDYVYMASDSAMLIDHAVTLADLKPGILYRFRVRSRDFAGNEGVSSDYQFQTPSGDAPVMPAGFMIALPTEMERITLSWTPNTETDLTGYNIYRAESRTGAFEKVNADPVTGTDTTVVYVDDGLKIAWKYYYYVKAVDSAMNESQPTEILSLVTPGILSENRTWKASESPYDVCADIRVRGGVILTVEPGVEVRFTQKDNIPDTNGASMSELIIQGGLYAVGTADKRIRFTSAENFPNKSNWGGIKFLGTGEPENQLKFVTLLFADTGIKSEGSSPVIENCELGLCGIGLDLGMSTALNIRYNVIRDCDVGLVSAGSNIRNNLFVKNQVGATLFGEDSFAQNTVDCLIGVEIHFGTPEIKNNIIAYSGSGQAIYGINQAQELATPSVSYNDIFNYAIPINNLTVATGTGIIEENPLFIGGTPFDYHLQTVAGGYASDSPCLTAGEGSVQMGRYGP